MSTSNRGNQTVGGLPASVDQTEAGYLDGVTSAIQTQLNAKAPTASPTFSGTITTPLTASSAVATGALGVLAASATTATELGYVSGVTSAIQTQITAKKDATAANYANLITWTTSTVNIASTSYVDITGVGNTAYTFPATRTYLFELHISAIQYVAVGNAITFGVSIDGAASVDFPGISLGVISTTGWGGTTALVATSVTAGSHNVKIQAKLASASGRSVNIDSNVQLVIF